jgi:hypothetical protein
MLNHEIKIHDRKQFEVKLHYPFNKKRSEREYLVETYFFIPSTLGINKFSFHKKNFYDSVKNYIRFATPQLSLKKLLNEVNSPLNKLYDIFSNKNSKEYNYNKIDDYEHELKMFCAIFTASVRKDFIEIIKNNKVDFTSITKEFIDNVKSIIKKYRALEEHIGNKKDYQEIFRFGDEYISLVIEKYLYIILYKYDKNIKHEDILVKNELLKLIKNEINHRAEKKYKSIIKEDSSNEEMLFRFSALKKYFSSVLSIEADVEKEGTILEQILFGIAAGIAMFFATVVAFWGQSSFGNFTMPFFIILIISYMFKDRIKEMLRETLKKNVFKYLYDYKYKLYIDEKYKVGVIRESFDFIKKKKLDKNIFKLRQKHRTIEFDNKFQKEKIILYRKKINIKSKFFKQQSNQGLIAITDIFRFDVTRFLSKMDDPKKTLFTLKDNKYKKIFGKRVYHINLILRIVRNKDEKLKRFRLVLTKKGIDRIEPVYDGTAKEIA